ncbi:hypothetical protein EJV46_07835 [Roseococcus sp. SYP-B2431]|uniref:hypothetical protein n=1 Tax=Roseococcus sp. SYP-B2431 TaxID=2496640 RepID=UPI00103B9835|nr:hypothetical protein [Roseococcus sp. SYP-B2431]TCH99222.1 hypothetical protein EJV46_07835 [Roseococcus sp. SYP-B2431]
MGHQRLGTLPASRAWQSIIALITGGADAKQVAAAVSDVAEPALAVAANDRALQHGFWLLTQIPLAARDAAFGEALQRIGLEVVAEPTITEIGAAVMSMLDDTILADRRSNDFSDLAATTVVESLVSVAARDEGSLFGSTYQADEAWASLRKLASPARFAVLVRDFVARLTREHLGYYLSRTLPAQVGQSHRFQSLRDHHLFETALTLHCREASLIVEQFAADWYGKHSFEGTLTPKTAAGFVQAAFKKVREELRARGGVVHA